MQEKDLNKEQEYDEDGNLVIEGEPVEELKDPEVEKIEEEKPTVDENEEKLLDLKNQMVRLQADFSNYKKRVEREKEGYVELGIKKLAAEILPVLDNLERAIKSIEDQGLADETLNGISMIDDQLIEVLRKNHVEEIKAEGEKFDHNFHHAVATVKVEGMEEGYVVDVLQRGYKMNDYIIRPSMVRVSE